MSNMPARNVADIDFKLLMVFDAVLRCGSLTLAADSLGITQPAISKSMQRLREYFDDPLMVRTTKGMEPTPKALELAPAVRDILDVFRNKLEFAPEFLPEQSSREFQFYATDLGNLIFLPRLLLALKQRAPFARLRSVQIEPKHLVTGLESGEIDIAIGAFPDFGAGIYQQRLYHESYICMVRDGHPVIGEVFDEARFLKEDHIVISAPRSGHAHRAAEEKLLNILGPERVALRVSSFLVPAMLLRDTDLIVTVPAEMGNLLAKEFNLVALKCPIPLPGFEVRQYWHERFHHDPAVRWFRSLVAEIFLKSASL
jgi:DNA-binding transcriptional LysR family regulator